MNKASLVTLWVEPKLHQIVKYTFDNVGLDFLPGRWLVHVDEIRASMVMREAFPDVWLPARLDVGAEVVFASGRVRFLAERSSTSDYREANVSDHVSARERALTSATCLSIFLRPSAGSADSALSSLIALLLGFGCMPLMPSRTSS